MALRVRECVTVRVTCPGLSPPLCPYQCTSYTSWEGLFYQRLHVSLTHFHMCTALCRIISYFLLKFLENWMHSICVWRVSVEKPLIFVVRGTADWFGVSKDGDSTQKWQRKSLRHCSLRYGKLKPQVIREMDLPSQDNISLTSTETPPPLYVPASQHGMQKVNENVHSMLHSNNKKRLNILLS